MKQITLIILVIFITGCSAKYKPFNERFLCDDNKTTEECRKDLQKMNEKSAKRSPSRSYHSPY